MYILQAHAQSEQRVYDIDKSSNNSGCVNTTGKKRIFSLWLTLGFFHVSKENSCLRLTNDPKVTPHLPSQNDPPLLIYCPTCQLSSNNSNADVYSANVCVRC